jgi:hypothetical protein
MGQVNREQCPGHSRQPANAPQDMQQTPQDEVFQSDYVLSEVDSELIWFGEESMYCLSCPEFQLTFYLRICVASTESKLRKLFKNDQRDG